MPLENGARLAPYEVISPIGAGGMGEVYEARDPRLNRTVAINLVVLDPGCPDSRVDFAAFSVTL
jgi:hypothetical protein